MYSIIPRAQQRRFESLHGHIIRLGKGFNGVMVVLVE